LRAAIDRGCRVLPVYIHAPEEEGDWSPGAASHWWLHDSLTSLAADLESRSSRLVLRKGPTLDTLRNFVRESGATHLFWNRRYEPAVRARDEGLKRALREGGLHVESFPGNLLREPWEVQTQSGGPFKVFTPFWKQCCRLEPPAAPLPKPRAISPPSKWPESLDLTHLKLLPRIQWDTGFQSRWTPGESGAHARLREFVAQSIEEYHQRRDRPDIAGTSSLSPHLHFGEVSPRQIYEAVTGKFGFPQPEGRGPKSGPMTFLSEVGWREFAWHVLYHFPHTTDAPLREKFTGFAWNDSAADLRAWQRGQTGYPIVDAGMRELWTTGWMHNRVRMVVGSFLTKHLRIDWRAGAQWFWDTLVDADLGNNSLGWQWISGCGADAAPYFRIFNPVTQGQKFDPAGDYVRRWVPELAGLPNEWLNHPWEAPAGELTKAGVTLGNNYPRPVVDHQTARRDALAAFAKIQAAGSDAGNTSPA
jgi:deoxyribodipyrimidine photo-lyase